jgi:hypothetical protein
MLCVLLRATQCDSVVKKIFNKTNPYSLIFYFIVQLSNSALTIFIREQWLLFLSPHKML